MYNRGSIKDGWQSCVMYLRFGQVNEGYGSIWYQLRSIDILGLRSRASSPRLYVHFIELNDGTMGTNFVFTGQDWFHA